MSKAKDRMHNAIENHVNLLMKHTFPQQPVPLFPLGQVVMTPGVQDVSTPDELQHFLTRHVTGDWGDVDKMDSMRNDHAVMTDLRILSAYTFPSSGERVWIITEADRSATTFLLPSEY